MQRFFELIIHGLRYYYHKMFLPYYFLGKNVAIDRWVRIYNPRDISIGDYVHLQENVWLNVVEPEVKKVLTIGKNCDIGRNSFLSAKQEITLEDYVLLAPNVYISDHSHRYDDKKVPIVLQGMTKPLPVRIGSGTWIGINSVILPGVTIGKNCVIGAGSVVNTSIPDFSVAVGSPAKVVRKIT